MKTALRQPVESVLRAPILVGAYALTLLPLIVTSSLVYPAVTGKGLVMRAMAVLLLAGWVVLAIAVPHYRPRTSPVLLTVIVWLALVGIADARGVDPYRSLWGTAERMEGFTNLLHLLALLIVLGSTVQAGRQWRRLLTLSVMVSTGIAGLASLESLFQHAIGSNGYRAQATFGNPSYLAAYLLAHLFLTAYLVATGTGSRRSNVLFGLAFVAQAGALVFTGTRGAVFGTVAGLATALGLIAFARLGRGERRIAMLLSLLLAAALAAGAVSQWQSRLPATAEDDRGLVVTLPRQQPGDLVLGEQHSLGQLRRLVGEHARLSDGLNARLVAWTVAAAAIRERPWSGWGQGTFEMATESHYDPRLVLGSVFDRPHNVVIGWAVSAGIPGLLAYLAVFGAALLAAFDIGRRRGAAAAAWLVGLLLAYGISNLFLFDTVTSYFVLALLLAFLHAEWIAARPRRRGAPRPRMATAAALPLALVAVLVITSLHLPAYRALRLWRDADPMSDLTWPDRMAALDTALALHTFADEELRRAYLELCSAAYGRRTPEQLRQQCFDRAVAGMKELVDRAPHRSRHLEDLGRFLLSAGRPSEGLHYLQMALDRVPRKPDVRVQVARALEAAGRHDAALQMARTAYELEPRHDWLRVFYSGLAYSQGHTELAVALLAPRAGEEVPQASVSGLLPADLGGDSTPDDRRWLAALMDFNARHNSPGGTWGTLRQLGEALPALARGAELSRAARRVDETVQRELRARANGAP